jgi:hypothetical protein
MVEFFNIITIILTGFFGMINSIIGHLLAVSLFGIPLLVFLASLDIIFTLLITLFDLEDEDN